jgi:hypothetical protein
MGSSSPDFWETSIYCYDYHAPSIGFRAGSFVIASSRPELKLLQARILGSPSIALMAHGNRPGKFYRPGLSEMR